MNSFTLLFIFAILFISVMNFISAQSNSFGYNYLEKETNVSNYNVTNYINQTDTFSSNFSNFSLIYEYATNGTYLTDVPIYLNDTFRNNYSDYLIIKGWNLTGLIRDWNATGLIRDWNDSGLINSNWNNNYSNFSAIYGYALNSTQSISGKGTSNYIPLWNATNQLNNSMMYQTTVGIGIGTTSPLHALTVNGTLGVGTAGIYFTNTTASAFGRVSGSTTGEVGINYNVYGATNPTTSSFGVYNGTTNIFGILPSGNVAIPTGNLTITSGSLAIGTTAGVQKLKILGAITDVPTSYGAIFVQPTYTFSADTSNNFATTYFQTLFGGTTNYTGTATGVQAFSTYTGSTKGGNVVALGGQAETSTASTGNLSIIYGLNFAVQTFGNGTYTNAYGANNGVFLRNNSDADGIDGNITNAYGANFQIGNLADTGLITNSRGLMVQTPSGTGNITTNYGAFINTQGTPNITNAYGLWLANQSGATTTNYAIYSVDGKNYLGGSLGVGVVNPLYKIDVNAGTSGTLSGARISTTNNLPLRLSEGGTSMNMDFSLINGSGDLRIGNGTAYFMTIRQSTGNVGINITAPTSTLHTIGTFNVSNISSYPIITTSSDGNVTFDGNGFFYDAISDRVGIETIKPQNTLNVLGTFNISNSSAYPLILTTNNNNITLGNNKISVINFTTGDTSKITCGAVYNHTMVSNATGWFICGVNGSLMRIW